LNRFFAVALLLSRAGVRSGSRSVLPHRPGPLIVLRRARRLRLRAKSVTSDPHVRVDLPEGFGGIPSADLRPYQVLKSVMAFTELGSVGALLRGSPPCAVVRAGSGPARRSRRRPCRTTPGARCGLCITPPSGAVNTRSSPPSQRGGSPGRQRGTLAAGSFEHSPQRQVVAMSGRETNPARDTSSGPIC